MPYTLFETLSQIDPFVQLNDGRTVASVRYRMSELDPTDEDEYVLAVDSAGRFLIFKLDFSGRIQRPPVLIEQKPSPVSGQSNSVRAADDFGIRTPGIV